MYQPIYLFRFNPLTGDTFILAGINEQLEIIVPPDGKWYFL
ncbi:MAG TPA: hypothetical protein V6D13_16955 [Halomicronema sp.]